MFTFLGAEFVHSNFGPVYPVYRHLWYVPSYSRPWTGRAVGSSRAGLWPLDFGSGWPAGRRAFAHHYSAVNSNTSSVTFYATLILVYAIKVHMESFFCVKNTVTVVEVYGYFKTAFNCIETFMCAPPLCGLRSCARENFDLYELVVGFFNASLATVA